MSFARLKISRSPLWLIFCLLPVLLAADLPEEAAKKLREGLQYFRDSQFAEAETAFAEASEIAPESYTIIFDEACAARANGDAEQARGLFLKAAQSREPDLSVKSHYNLGCLEADVAREQLGQDPGAAEGDVRTESINQLLSAVRHYRDVLRFQPQHPDARHNLELIRLFIKHIQSEWAERDKQKARDEKDLLQFLKMIEDQETELRSVSRVLGKEDSSASQRKLLRETGDSQSALQEEIEPLKQKITEQIQQSQQQAGGGAASSAPAPDQQQAEQLLHQLADMAGQGMLKAASSLAAADFAVAEEAQTETLDHLNQMYMAIAPYQDILQKAIQEQSPLVPAESVDVESPAEQSDSDKAVDESNQPAEATVNVATEPNEPQEVDFAAVQETQSRITDWSRMLSLKAESELPQVQQQLETMQQNAGPVSEDSPDAATELADPELAEADKDTAVDEPELTEEQQAALDQQKQMEQQLKQLQGLVKSMELAIKLAPDAEEHSQAAVQFLMAKDSLAATPEQLETLRILNEIAEPLVKDPQDQNDQQQDQKDQDQQNDDQKNDDQQQNEDQKQDPSQQEKPEPQDEQQKQSEEEQQKESKQQQAESILRQARDRERQYRELEKERNAIMLRGIKVDKDW